MTRRPTAIVSILALIAAGAGCAAAERATVQGGFDGDSSPAATGEVALKGAIYEPGCRFVQKYCAGCHWKYGQDPKQKVAYPAFHVDTYDDWAASRTILLAVLDKWHPDGDVMPPLDAIEPPDDDRQTMLDWIRRQSPNTHDGK